MFLVMARHSLCNYAITVEVRAGRRGTHVVAGMHLVTARYSLYISTNTVEVRAGRRGTHVVAGMHLVTARYSLYISTNTVEGRDGGGGGSLDIEKTLSVIWCLGSLVDSSFELSIISETFFGLCFYRLRVFAN
jgi:hypothetical protein